MRIAVENRTSAPLAARATAVCETPALTAMERRDSPVAPNLTEIGT